MTPHTRLVRGDDPYWKALGRWGFRVQAAGIFGASALLYLLIFSHRYEFEYVWKHLNDAMPFGFNSERELQYSLRFSCNLAAGAGVDDGHTTWRYLFARADGCQWHAVRHSDRVCYCGARGVHPRRRSPDVGWLQ